MKKKASKILLTVLTLTAISIPTYASNQMPTKFNATTKMPGLCEMPFGHQGHD